MNPFQMRSKCWVATVGIVGLLLTEGYGASAARAEEYPVCEEYCGPDAACNDVCGVWNTDHYDYINCGEYNGGPDNNMCQTCDQECTIWSAPEQECWKGGNLTDCGTEGPAIWCGDGVCQSVFNGEGCDNCDEDCGACPDIYCGDSQCDPGESYLNCDQDCDDPGPFGGCGDGVCSKDEEEDDNQNPNYCPEDCIAPNDRCDDDFDCGAGYTCATRGIPMGGRCVLLTSLGVFPQCDEYGDCPAGLTCVEIDQYPDPESLPVCLPEFLL